jgi:hypothetical protein
MKSGSSNAANGENKKKIQTFPSDLGGYSILSFTSLSYSIFFPGTNTWLFD